MNILLPTTITEAMILAGTSIPSVDTASGEVAWLASGNYVIGDERVSSGGIYSCVKAHTATGASPKPEDDAVNWLYKSPTNRMAPFDEYIYTTAKRATELRYVLQPGFFNGVALYGIDADSIDVTLRETDGGAVLESWSGSLYAQAFGEWEYLFGNLQRETKWARQGLPIRPAATIDVKLTRNVPGTLAELGYMAVGQWKTLLAPMASVGGTQYGAEVTPKSYSYFKRNDDGTYTRRKGRTAKLITATVMIGASEAPAVEALLASILDVPVPVETSGLPRYGHLSTVGFVTGSIVAQSHGIATVNIKVDGNI